MNCFLTFFKRLLETLLTVTRAQGHYDKLKYFFIKLHDVLNRFQWNVSSPQIFERYSYILFFKL
jgi:hypothetical protein